MVIQRWQSLFLLIAVILVAIFCCTPYALIADGESIEISKVFVYQDLFYLILNVQTAIMLFLSIFLYKNLKLQISITKVSLWLLATSIIYACLMVFYAMPDAELIWFGGIMLLVIAMIFTFMGMRFMQKDQKLLKSYDRLR